MKLCSGDNHYKAEQKSRSKRFINKQEMIKSTILKKIGKIFSKKFINHEKIKLLDK